MEKSVFWNNVWTNTGCPKTGQLDVTVGRNTTGLWKGFENIYINY